MQWGYKLNQNKRNKQEGFILITVMILTMMAGTIVLTSLEDSVVQERLSGNFQKKINSRLMAEKGVYASLNEMNTQLAANSSLTMEQMKTNVESSTAMNAGDSTQAYGLTIITNPDNPNEISVISKGSSYEGEVQLKAIYELVSGLGSSGGNPFVAGIAACKAISVTGSGGIDSYNSASGAYSTDNNGDNVSIQTLVSDSAVTFTGGTEIDGNIIAADTITFSGGAKISGNMESIGAITATVGNVSIGGNVSTLSSFDQKNGSVGGTIHANGPVTLNQTPVGGNVISRSTINITGVGTDTTSFNGNSVSLRGIGGYVLALGNVTLPNGGEITQKITTHGIYSQKGGTVSGGILAQGNITLNNGTINGGASSHGQYSHDGGTLSGGVLAQGNISLTGGTINGSVVTGEDYTQTGGTLNGSLSVVRNLNLKRYNSTITGAVYYGGTGKWISNTDAFDSKYVYVNPAPAGPSIEQLPEVPLFISSIIDTDSSSSSTTCDAEDIASKIAEVSDGISSAKNLIISGTGSTDTNNDRPTGENSGDVYVMNSSSADFALFTGGNGKSESVLKNMQNLDTTVDDTDANNTETQAKWREFFGVKQNVLMYTDVEIKGHLKVGGATNNQDVTMYVKGDFTMSGAGSLTIYDGSSLTLIIEGKVEIASGAQVNTPDNGITPVTQKPVFSIYSSYSGTDEGIYFGGGTKEVYAVIYAPLTIVEVASGVGFGGSIYGSVVTVTGAGGVHYDTALGQFSSGNSSSTPATGSALVFKGWEYITDDPTINTEAVTDTP